MIECDYQGLKLKIIYLSNSQVWNTVRINAKSRYICFLYVFMNSIAKPIIVCENLPNPRRRLARSKFKRKSPFWLMWSQDTFVFSVYLLTLLRDQFLEGKDPDLGEDWPDPNPSVNHRSDIAKPRYINLLYVSINSIAKPIIEGEDWPDPNSSVNPRSD